MGKIVEDIIGAKVQRFEGIYDYWHIITDKGIINIYNPSKYYTTQEKYLEIKDVKEEDLINAIVTNITFKTTRYLKFELNNKNILKTSLKEEDYTGPEAVSVHYNTGDVIVFE